MTISLIRQQWKAFWRSKSSGKNLTVKIILGVLIVYMFFNLLVVGFFLDEILKEVFPSKAVITAFNSLIIYYFLADLLMRFQLQELPTLSVKPYLNLPIQRGQLVKYLSFISLWTGFNLAPFILLLPFLIKVIIPAFGIAVFWGYLAAILGLIIFNHFFSIWLKRKVNLNAFYMLGFLLMISAIAFADFSLKILSISALSENLFNGLIIQPFNSTLALFLGLVMYIANHYYLKSSLYLDDLDASSTTKKSVTDIPFFKNFGRPGELAANELKLILRNKRPKSALFMSFFFLFYGLVFYYNPKLGTGYASAIFCGMFMTGIFIINYGQFMFSWQSGHFDGILSSKVKIHDFFRGKMLLFSMFSTVNVLLTIPYVYFGWKILLIHATMYLWNLGVNTLIVLYFANRNYKRIDLSKSASFNWEGVGATQWLLSIPLLLSPYVLFLPALWLGYPALGLALIAFTGFIFIVSREFWIAKLVLVFKEKRYQIAEGFRNE